MERSYVICHMTMSIDGKVTGDYLGTSEVESAIEAYYRINRDFKADAFACGRVTMEGSFTNGWYPDLTEFAGAKIERKDYVADKEANYFAAAFDRRGRLGWKEAKIVDEDPGYGDAHIIEVLCEDVSDAYLAYLQKVGVSYIFAGESEMNISLALLKLKKLFGIEKLLLEGGSIINGAFVKEDVVDELSLVIAPVIASADDKPLFWNSDISGYSLMKTTTMEDDVVWMQYKKRR